MRRHPSIRQLAVGVALLGLAVAPAAAKPAFDVARPALTVKAKAPVKAKTALERPVVTKRHAPTLRREAVERVTQASNPRADGFRLLRSGDPEGALAAFLEAVQLQPRDPHVWRLIGDLQLRLEHPELALDAWEKAIELWPGNTALLDRVARVATEIGALGRALTAQRALVEELRDRALAAPDAERLDLGIGQREPMTDNYVRHLVIYSELAVMAGDFTTGEQAARELIRFRPTHVAGHLALAYMHLQAAEFEDAEDIYDEVLAVDPANTIALNNLGNIHYMRRDLDGAAAHFERILSVEGVRPYSESIALANLAELLQLQGAYRDAYDLYKQAIEAKPDGAWSYMGLAALYDIVGQTDDAIDLMIDGWERDRSGITRLNMHFYDAEWFWQRDALIAEIEGDTDVARELWTRILHGDVPVLQKAAAQHLASLDADER